MLGGSKIGTPAASAVSRLGLAADFLRFPESTVGRVTNRGTSCSDCRIALKVGTANGPVPNMRMRILNKVA